MKQYVFNKETLKIELHFDKCDYLALSEEQKSQLKGAFLWSSKGSCWVSRAKEPNLYWAKKIATELGFEKGESVGERLTFAEQVEKKQERAEARAERYEDRAECAMARCNSLQSAFKEAAKDWSFVTQPNINTSSGRAFSNYRQRLLNRYERGFEEYKKSEYFLHRAKSASETANMSKLNDKGYLYRKIRECQKDIKGINKVLVNAEEKLFKIENGETVKNYQGVIETAENAKERLQNYIERIESAMDKQAYFENRLDELGGLQFNQDNIKVGDNVRLFGGLAGKVISVGRLNIRYVSEYARFGLTAAFAEIKEHYPSKSI